MKIIKRDKKERQWHHPNVCLRSHRRVGYWVQVTLGNSRAVLKASSSRRRRKRCTAARLLPAVTGCYRHLLTSSEELVLPKNCLRKSWSGPQRRLFSISNMSTITSRRVILCQVISFILKFARSFSSGQERTTVFRDRAPPDVRLAVWYSVG